MTSHRYQQLNPLALAVAALVGAIFAWIYNAVNAVPRADPDAGQPGSGQNVPASR